MTRYERPLVSNGFVTIQSNYEYVLGEIEGNALKFQLDFSQGGWLKDEVKIIANELENTAKFFAEEQGLKKEVYINANGNEVRLDDGRTGHLYDSIQAKPDGFDARLTANAVNSRGQYYAGHIEYGFHDRGDNFIPGRPFLRPALYAVSESTKGHVRGVMKHLIEDMWSPGGYQGYRSLTFDRLVTNTGKYRSLMNQPVSGSKSGLKTRQSLEKLRLDTKKPNYRQKFRRGDVNRKFSWDRYKVKTYPANFKKNHLKWYHTSQEKPEHFRPRWEGLRESARKDLEKETLRTYALANYLSGKPLKQEVINTLTGEERNDYYAARRVYNERRRLERERRKRKKDDFSGYKDIYSGVTQKGSKQEDSKPITQHRFKKGGFLDKLRKTFEK